VGRVVDDMLIYQIDVYTGRDSDKILKILTLRPNIRRVSILHRSISVFCGLDLDNKPPWGGTG
jgi:hypothetical protein